MFAMMALSGSANADLSPEKQRSCLMGVGYLPVMEFVKPQLVDTRKYPEEAGKVFEPGGYKLLVNEFIRLAEEGNLEAQWSLGILYERGECVIMDDQKAVHWQKEAAKGGYPPAVMRFGDK